MAEDVVMVSEEDIKELERKPATQAEIMEDGIEVIANEMSPTVGKLAEGLSNAQTAMSNGAKDKEGYGYSYMTLGGLTDIIRPQLAPNGLALIQTHSLDKSNPAKPAVYVHTALMHSSGEWYKNSIAIPIAIMKQLSVAQMMGVSMTYGRRYALQSVFMIASEDDTDASTKS